MPREISGRVLVALLTCAVAAGAAEAPPEKALELPPFIVTQERTPGEAAALPLGGVLYEREALEGRESMAVDDFLRQTPGFSLFRRTSSRVANPTTQGPTLRGIGPSGAGRALVLLDGVPLNDAFGGWVHWSRLNLANIESIEVLRGGGSSAWGSGALGGVIQLRTAPPPTGQSSLRTSAEAGTRDTARFRIGGAIGGERASFGISARHFETGGYVRTAPELAGAVDIPSTSRHQALQSTGAWDLGTDTQLTWRGSLFDEKRGNGTPLTQNSTEAARAQVGLRHETGGVVWQFDAFADRTIYASTFSSVAPDRNSEVLVLDQFRVPAHSAGAALVAGGEFAPGATWTLGTDWRQVRGETREWVVFPDHIRVAGGRQQNVGAFADAAYRAGPWELSGALRLDHWRDDRGSFHLSARQSGAEIRSETFAPLTDQVWSPRLGLRWLPHANFTVRAAAYEGFRMPTLNERYRPFQVGSDRTFANENLRAERLRGAEMGADFFSGSHRLSLTLFRSELRDAIANVSIGPNPRGGEDRQRRNLAVLENTGLELEWVRQLRSDLRLSAAYAWTDARIQRAPAAPQLEGNRSPQTARHGLAVSGSWRAKPSTEVNLTGRYQSALFEDDLNTRRLGSYFVVDVHVAHRLSPRAGELFLAVENLFDRRYYDGWTGANLRTLASPRWASIGWRGEF